MNAFIDSKVNWFLNLTIPTQIALTCIFLFFGLLIVIPILIKLKGSVSIHLKKISYSLGDTISGKVIIRPRSEYHCKEATMHLLCLKRSSSSKSNTMTLYENKILIAQDITLYPGGTTNEIPFSIEVPQKVSGEQSISKQLEELVPKEFKKYTSLLIGQSSHNIEWYLITNFDVKGIDFNAKKRIYLKSFK